MTNSYMQMIYIDSDDQARHTNVAAAMETNALTWAAFRSYRHLEVSKERAQFVLDYYNAKEELAATILLDADGFARISGESVKTDAEYRQIDSDYWAAAIAERKAA